jgi:8-oxo-dGTP pyrophosphatase MutT (NUDIX family)
MRSVAEALRGVLGPATPDPPMPEGVPAGVVVPVLDGLGATVLLTRRTDTVRTHKGEISFPGGVRHADDPDLLRTALRETEEELGIPADAFEVLGRLPPTLTVVSGFAVLPFVGVLRARPALRPSAIEIAEVVELPLARLLGVEREVHVQDWGRGWFEYRVDGHLVWGATGRIMHSFLETLRAGRWMPEEEG